MSVLDFRAAASAILGRMNFANWAGLTFGGRRNLYQILGYKQALTYWDYRDRYARDGVAKAVVDTYPEATWRGGVEVYEDEDPAVSTEFERGFKDLVDNHGFWQSMQQADILTGLSTFSVLLIGVSGTSPLTEELPKGEQLLFLKSYAGGGGPGVQGYQQQSSQAYGAFASVARYVVDPQDARFGEPLSYYIRNTTPGASFLNYEVHWSRVIHIAEGCLEDNVFGIPRLECVFNLFDDLAKVTGGGAESFWIRANQGLHLDVDKDMGMPGTPTAGQAITPVQVQGLKDAADEMLHQQQRVLVTRGVTATPFGSDVANFGPPSDALLKQIAGAARIPMRILTGSEMGTLASEQDAANFDSRVQDRRTGYAGPKMVRRTLDRLIAYGYLPTPVSYEVGWPVEENMDEKGKADYANSLANVNKTYGATIFDDTEIRDMAFNMKPLDEKAPWESLTELDKATVAKTLALVNKEQGITVYTDDEIRMMSHGLKPLTDAEKVPIGAPEKISVTKAPAIGGDGLPVAEPMPLAAQLKALERAIEADDLEAIGELLNLGGPGSGPHPGSGKDFGDSTQRVIRVDHREGANSHERVDVTKAIVKSAHNDLKTAGFVKGATESKTTAATKAGRSQAFTGARKDSETHYSHADGRTAVMRVEMPKYNDHSVIVVHSAKMLGLTDGPHSYSTTQVQLPDSFLGFGQQIPDSDLADKGRETDPHVTLKYGLLTNDPELVVATLAGSGPITLTLGKMNYFETPDGDALYAEVRSDDLTRLNARITKTLDTVETQNEYIPHATIAYLKPGMAAKYVGDATFEGQQHVVSQVTFSNADGERMVISVSGF